MTVTVYSWILPLVALIAYAVGIITEKIFYKNAGEILVDYDTGKILFNFSIMPEDLSTMSYILMKVRKVKLANTNDSSDSENT